MLFFPSPPQDPLLILLLSIRDKGANFPVLLSVSYIHSQIYSSNPRFLSPRYEFASAAVSDRPTPRLLRDFLTLLQTPTLTRQRCRVTLFKQSAVVRPDGSWTAHTPAAPEVSSRTSNSTQSLNSKQLFPSLFGVFLCGFRSRVIKRVFLNMGSKSARRSNFQGYSRLSMGK